MNHHLLRFLTTAIATVFVIPALSITAFAQTAGTAETKNSPPDQVKEATLGKTRNVHQCGNLYLAGQFSASDIAAIRASGIKRVITLRTDGEINWDEAGALKAAGIELIQVPFRSPDSLTDKVFDKIRKLLKDDKTATLFHCGSANRVGGVWLPFRVLDEGVKLETAFKEAKTIGLRNEAYEKKALDYIDRQQHKQ